MTTTNWLPNVEVCDQIPASASLNDVVYVNTCRQSFIYMEGETKCEWKLFMSALDSISCASGQCLIARLAWGGGRCLQS